MIAIEVAQRVTDELVEAVGRLVRQLSSSSTAPGREALAAIVASPATSLLVARQPELANEPTDLSADGPVLGMLTLAVFRIPTGVRAWIEDVVVDEAARGQGVGAALTRRALELAAEAGARTVELTSRPSRADANRLYQRLGFQVRETNVYRFTGAH